MRLMATILTAAAIAAGAAAQPEKVFVTPEGMRFEILTDSTVSVGKLKDKDPGFSGVVTIPGSITAQGKTYTVTKVKSWGFFGCNDVTEFVIPSTITELDIWAFSCCEGLKRIVIPESVTKIGYAALDGCKQLTDVNLHEENAWLPTERSVEGSVGAGSASHTEKA